LIQQVFEGNSGSSFRFLRFLASKKERNPYGGSSERGTAKRRKIKPDRPGEYECNPTILFNCLAEGLTLTRISKLLYHVRRIAIILDKNFTEASKDDIVQLVKENLKSLRGTGEFPDEVKWIKPNFKKNNHKARRVAYRGGRQETGKQRGIRETRRSFSFRTNRVAGSENF